MATRRCLPLALGALVAAVATAPAVVAGAEAVGGSCTEAVVVERHYGAAQQRSDGIAVKEIYLTLSNGQRIDGPAMLGTSGFFWDYTPGHKVGLCVEAHQPQRLQVTDRVTGASFLSHPTRSL
ncbi:MAG: hypothetical protein RLZZ11_175 [Cyanobacteriota bacterium]|jgi:hypothetical protein